MTALVLITPEGVVLDNNPPTLSDEVGVYTTENELWKVAAREAAKQSTKTHQQGNDHV